MDKIYKIPKKPTKFAEKPNSSGLPKVLFNEKNQITKFLPKFFFTFFDQSWPNSSRFVENHDKKKLVKI